MKILWVGDTRIHGRSFQRLRALRELGHQVLACALYETNRSLEAKPPLLERVAWKAGFPVDSARANEKMLLAIRECPTFDVLWIQKGNTIWPRTLRRIKQDCPNIKIISYSEDDMFNRKNRSVYFARGLSLYDVVFTTKSYNCSPDELPSLGAKNVRFFYQAFDPHSHYPVPIDASDRETYGGDVGFIGTFETERAMSMKFLAEHGIKIRIWGGGWDHFRARHFRHIPNMIVEPHGLYGHDYRKGIGANRINLCFLRKANRDLHTSRSVEIPACGGFMLAERTPEHLRLFREDQEAVFFGDNTELLEKTRFYLNHETRRQDIAAAGLKRCQSGHYTHHDRLQWMLASI